MIEIILRVFAINFDEAFDIMAEELDSLGLESDLDPSEYDFYVDGKDDDSIKKLEDKIYKHLSMPFSEEDVVLKDIKSLEAAIYYLEEKKNLRDNNMQQPSDFDIREHRIDLSDYQIYTVNPEDEGNTTMFFFVMQMEADEL